MLVLGWVTAWEYMVLYSFFEHISFDGLPRERNTLYTKFKPFFLMAFLCLNDQATLLEYNTLKGVYQNIAFRSVFRSANIGQFHRKSGFGYCRNRWSKMGRPWPSKNKEKEEKEEEEKRK